MGYDVSNYEAVYVPYGTVKEVEDLIETCHEHDMKLILDLVVNHTSDQHAWFKESWKSKDDPKRDWYFWLVLNVMTEVQRLPEGDVQGMEVLVSSYGKVGAGELQPLEGRVYVNY